MKELGNFIKICIVLFILLTVTYSDSIKPSTSKKLNNIVNYINKTFVFSSKDDKNTFQLNQKLWLKSAKNDCYIAYADIGSPSAFSLYYNSCMEDIQDKRILILLNLYLCNISTMSEEVCQLPSEIFEEVMLLVNNKIWYPKTTVRADVSIDVNSSVVILPKIPNTPNTKQTTPLKASGSYNKN